MKNLGEDDEDEADQTPANVYGRATVVKEAPAEILKAARERRAQSSRAPPLPPHPLGKAGASASSVPAAVATSPPPPVVVPLAPPVPLGMAPVEVPLSEHTASEASAPVSLVSAHPILPTRRRSRVTMQAIVLAAAALLLLLVLGVSAAVAFRR